MIQRENKFLSTSTFWKIHPKIPQNAPGSRATADKMSKPNIATGDSQESSRKI